MLRTPSTMSHIPIGDRDGAILSSLYPMCTQILVTIAAGIGCNFFQLLSVIRELPRCKQWRHGGQTYPLNLCRVDFLVENISISSMIVRPFSEGDGQIQISIMMKHEGWVHVYIEKNLLKPSRPVNEFKNHRAYRIHDQADTCRVGMEAIILKIGLTNKTRGASGFEWRKEFFEK